MIFKSWTIEMFYQHKNIHSPNFTLFFLSLSRLYLKRYCFDCVSWEFIIPKKKERKNRNFQSKGESKKKFVCLCRLNANRTKHTHRTQNLMKTFPTKRTQFFEGVQRTYTKYKLKNKRAWNFKPSENISYKQYDYLNV